MKIIEMGRKLTEKEQLGIQMVERYLNGWGDFAMLNDHVFVPLNDTKVSDGIDVAKEKVFESIDKMQSAHPDFSSYLMKDDHVLVLVRDLVGAFDRQVTSVEEYNNKGINFQKVMTLRNELFEACEQGEIIALVDIEKQL